MTKADATNGSFTVSPEKALEGDEITVTATPDEGYAVDTMTYTDSDGKVTDFTSTGKVTMPASDITVSVTFKAKELTGKWVKNHKGYVGADGKWIPGYKATN